MQRIFLTGPTRKISASIAWYLIFALGFVATEVIGRQRLFAGQVYSYVPIPPVAQSTMPNPTPTFTVQAPAMCNDNGLTSQLIPDGGFVRQKKDNFDPGTLFNIDVASGNVVGHCDVFVWGHYDHADYRKVVSITFTSHLPGGGSSSFPIWGRLRIQKQTQSGTILKTPVEE